MIIDPRDDTEYKVFDAHTHWSRLVSWILTKWPFKKLLYMIALPELVEYIITIWKRVKKSTKSKAEFKAKLFLELLDFYRIDKAVILTIFGFDNNFTLRTANIFPDRIIPFINISPKSSPKKLEKKFQQFKGTNWMGVKFAPHFQHFHVKVHREGIERIYNWVQESKRIVLFHTGSHSEIDDIFEIAKNYPDVPTILGHSGLSPQIDNAINAARQATNIFLETSGQPYIYKIQDALKDKEIGPERILYGSDFPTLHPFVEQERILSLNASVEVKRLIFSRNIENLIKTRKI
ncbi:MAG: amidohydrolase family protein [Promethearchaeota archaeon]